MEKNFSLPTQLGEIFLWLSAALARLSSIRGSLTCMKNSALLPRDLVMIFQSLVMNLPRFSTLKDHN